MTDSERWRDACLKIAELRKVPRAIIERIDQYYSDQRASDDPEWPHPEDFIEAEIRNLHKLTPSQWAFRRTHPGPFSELITNFRDESLEDQNLSDEGICEKHEITFFQMLNGQWAVIWTGGSKHILTHSDGWQPFEGDES
jgi:hypothetical protein